MESNVLTEIQQRQAEELVIKSVRYVDEMFQNSDSVREALKAAVNTEIFMKIFRERIAVAAASHAPEILEIMSEKAVSDDKDAIAAARLVLEVAGITKQGNKTNVNLANINVLPDEAERIRKLAAEAIDIG